MAKNSAPEKILVIDDDPGILRLLEKTLKGAHGYEVITANESRIGFQKARDENPDLIVLDILIPDMSGGELAKKLQEDPLTRDIPIVFISVVLDAGGKKRIDIDGKLYRAVSKPLYQPELLSAIRKTLNEYAHTPALKLPKESS
jgi:CheY-like chemotaxis protein